MTVKLTRFDSRFEETLHHNLFCAKNAIYHPPHIKYTDPVIHKYTPDWRIELKDQVILVEAKGRFRDAMDAKRYINIRQALPVDVELVFLFQRPSEPMPRRSRRLDGTRFSVADWAEKHDFKWYSALTFPRRWLKKR